MSDLTIDGDQIHSAVINIGKGLIPGAKILCGGCHQKAVIEEYKKVIEADIDVR
ncbi:MAG: hypothetical protein ACWGP1_02785 [Syntrophobacteria bacterium]